MRDESLQSVREDWEQDSVNSWEFAVKDAVIAILEWEYSNDDGSFSVHRYFKIGKNWMCSVDASLCHIRDAIATVAQLVTDHYNSN